MSAKPKEANLVLETHLRELGLAFEPEYRFHNKRLWRFDYRIKAIEDGCVAIEIEGGIWNRGRHTRGKGFQGDLDKYNAASAEGWRVFRFSTEDVLTGRAKQFLKEHLLKRTIVHILDSLERIESKKSKKRK